MTEKGKPDNDRKRNGKKMPTLDIYWIRIVLLAQLPCEEWKQFLTVDIATKTLLPLSV